MSKFAILFLIVYVSGVLSVILKGPVWGFYLYELVYFLNPKHRWWIEGIPDIRYSYYLVILMLTVFIFQFKQQKNMIKEMPEAKWLMGVFFCYGISTVVAVNPEMNSIFMGHLINTWVVMYVAYRMLDTEDKLKYALLFYIIGAAYIGYEAMIVGRDAFGRVEGIGTVDAPDANTIAASIVPAIPLLIYFVWTGSRRVKILSGISALFVVNGLILINSRGAFLGASLGFSYFLAAMMFSKYKLPKQRIMIVLIIVLTMVVLFRLVDHLFIERLATLENQSSINSEGSGGRRMQFWMATFDLLKDHPFGVGIYGFETLSAMYLDSSLFEGGREARAVHSIWFQGLSEIGWLGFAFFVSMLVSIFNHLRKAKKLLVDNDNYRQYYFLIAIEAGFLGFLLSSTFINMFRTQILYWMMLFSICASVISIRVYSLSDKKE